MCSVHNWELCLFGMCTWIRLINAVQFHSTSSFTCISKINDHLQITMTSLQNVTKCFFNRFISNICGVFLDIFMLSIT